MRLLPTLLYACAPFVHAACLLAQSPSFSIQDLAGDHLDLLFHGKAVVRYQYAYDPSTPERLQETYKPYLHFLDAEGKALITKGPGGEFPHHRGLFLGWSKLTTATGTIDRWHMKGGNIVHQKILSQKADANSAEITSLIHWQGQTETPVIEEERTFILLPPPAPAYALLEMRTELRSMDGQIQLDGDPEHAGIQFRPGIAINRPETSYLYPKANAEPHKDRDYPWVAERISIDGKHYTVAFLNHPENPQGTPFSAYRDYGRFGAFFRTSIPPQGKVTMKIRILLAEGWELSAQQIQEAENAFTGRESPMPDITERPAEKPAPKKEPAENKK